MARGIGVTHKMLGSLTLIMVVGCGIVSITTFVPSVEKVVLLSAVSVMCCVFAFALWVWLFASLPRPYRVTIAGTALLGALPFLLIVGRLWGSWGHSH